MILKIKTALDAIKPDKELLLTTEQRLRANAEKGKLRVYKRLSIAACLVLAVGLLSVSGYAVYKTPVSFVDIDINPSLELGINRFDRVVTVSYLNEDAKNLISEAVLLGSKPETAVDLVIQAASDRGYIKDDQTTVISVVASGGEDSQAEALLGECVSSIDGQNDEIAVYSGTVSSELRQEADAASISAGKLKLIKMVQTLDSTASVEDYKDTSVTDIVDYLTYLTSDTDTSISEDEKSSVQSSLSGVTSQIKEIDEKKERGEQQAQPEAQPEESAQPTLQQVEAPAVETAEKTAVEKQTAKNGQQEIESDAGGANAGEGQQSAETQEAAPQNGNDSQVAAGQESGVQNGNEVPSDKQEQDVPAPADTNKNTVAATSTPKWGNPDAETRTMNSPAGGNESPDGLSTTPAQQSGELQDDKRHGQR